MADYDYWNVQIRDEDTRKLRLRVLPESDIKVLDFGPGKMRFHDLTEGTISIANTGAATDTRMYKDTQLFNYTRKDLFNSTLQNLDKQSQVIMGMLFSVDMTKMSPDTDKDHVDFDISFRTRIGGTPTYEAKVLNALTYAFEAKWIVEAAAIGTVKYAGPLILPFMSPHMIQKNESILEYISGSCELRQTDLGAFTVVTTCTIKVAASLIIIDPEVLAQYDYISEFWNELMKGD